MAEKKFFSAIDFINGRIKQRNNLTNADNAREALVFAEALLEWLIIQSQHPDHTIFPSMENWGIWMTRYTGLHSGTTTRDNMFIISDRRPEYIEKERKNIIQMIAAYALLDPNVIATYGLHDPTVITIETFDQFADSPWDRLKRMNDLDYNPVKVFLYDYDVLQLTPEEAYQRVRELTSELNMGALNMFIDL